MIFRKIEKRLEQFYRDNGKYALRGLAGGRFRRFFMTA
jgi:hypothetical protein